MWHQILQQLTLGEKRRETDGTYDVWPIYAILFGFGEAIIFVKYNRSDIRSLTSVGGGKSCSYRNWYAIKSRHGSMR